MTRISASKTPRHIYMSLTLSLAGGAGQRCIGVLLDHNARATTRVAIMRTHCITS